MSKKIIYEEHPFGDVKLGKKVILPDLPAPEQIPRAMAYPSSPEFTK